jgi:PAS domain S-box-containing protein
MPHYSRRRVALVAGVVLSVVVFGATAAALWRYQQAALDQGGEHLVNLALALGGQTDQAVHGIDLVLRATAEDYGGSGDGKPLPAARVRERMIVRLGQTPQLRTIIIVDAAGDLVAHSREHPVPAVSYADREYFTMLRDSPGRRLHVSAPVIGRNTGEWTHVVSHAVLGPDGTFRGVVAAVIDVPYFHRLYRSISLGRDGRVFLFRDDGVLLADYPGSVEATGRSFAGHGLFAGALVRGGRGVLQAPGFLDAQARLIAYRGSADTPLAVAVSSTRDHILAHWRRVAWQVGLGSIGVLLAIALGLSLLVRQYRVGESLVEEVRENAARLDGIIHSAMDAIITVDEDQRIVLFNEAAERAFRCPAAQALGASLDRFVPERFRTEHREHIRRFAETGVTTRMMGDARLALYGLRADGEEFPIDASISQVTIHGRKLFTVMLRDVTQRKQDEAQISRERDTAQRYLDLVNVMLVARDADGRVALINRRGCEVLGFPEEEIVGRSWFDRFLPEREREDTRTVFRQIMAGKTGLAELHENAVLTSSGAERVIAWHNRVLTDENGTVTGTLSSGEDVTERRQAEDALQRSYHELRELSAAMHEVREAERTRIARELHDELAQWLTALKMDVAWLAVRLPADERPLADRAERMKQLVDSTVASVRRIAAALRPVMLDDLGLVPALEHLVHEFSQRTGVVVSLDLPADGMEFGEPLATSYYRVAQEALTNVARHAGASKVEVVLRCEGDTLVLRVRDNGKGFDAEAVRGRSYGVLGIRERAHTLGGIARIESLPEGGTLVEMVVPLERYVRRESA